MGIVPEIASSSIGYIWPIPANELSLKAYDTKITKTSVLVAKTDSKEIIFLMSNGCHARPADSTQTCNDLHTFKRSFDHPEPGENTVNLHFEDPGDQLNQSLPCPMHGSQDHLR
jgi:hypothetical protein